MPLATPLSRRLNDAGIVQGDRGTETIHKPIEVDILTINKAYNPSYGSRLLESGRCLKVGAEKSTTQIENIPLQNRHCGKDT